MPASIFAKCCILIPFKDCHNILYDCLAAVVAHLPADAQVLLIDDGSETNAANSPLSEFLAHPQIVLLHHSMNRGAGAARNTGINWCRSHDIEIVILLDSDCLVQSGFVETHCRLHGEYPNTTCIGGGIQGVGEGIWAKIDGLMSWFTSIPSAPMREVSGVYHIPTTNMSLKLSHLDDFKPQLFDEKLCTGEDVVFVRQLIKDGLRVIFYPQPVVWHCDRSTFKDFLQHQWRWGLHTYIVRLGNKGWGNAKRFAFGGLFALCLPAFALFCTTLNIIPWLKRSPFYLKYYPVLFLVYFYKSIAVLIGIFCPNTALHPLRKYMKGIPQNNPQCVRDVDVWERY